MMNKIALLYTTIAFIDDAEKLAEKAVTEKFATCVNIIPHARSVYIWEGKVEKSSECLLIFKTSIDCVDRLQTWLTKEHPYTLPAILKGSVESSLEFSQYIQAHLASF